ncbi:low molecular weight protein-tyrosine-phosphatase [Paraburkholderia antibiotica]|uniref:protein-tyrosine-phosphatase n=1 Tax=Paraburkholderia antibiotica TaxID=2728839 RepID=A0A7X9X3C4_9BURK|nr:low molecular weight protein-tyrosine-phosphatase [Paraburkholderia antibiotica]NML30282.1 low molecular weight phosphotyrosine protein phosphatase [Paraburkholderia antibiotica]
MIARVLVVCVGNICRSPMAEALLAQRLGELTVTVESAGIEALIGAAADPLALDLMRQRGLDIGAHRARQLTGWMAEAADLVLVMDRAQKQYVERRFPSLVGRVYLLGPCQGTAGPAAARFEIPDPYRKGLVSFEQSLVLIEAGVDEWSARIAGVAARAGTSALSTDSSSS